MATVTNLVITSELSFAGIFSFVLVVMEPHNSFISNENLLDD